MFFFTPAARIISFAWKNFTRNAWIGLATVMVLVLALLSVNVLVAVNVMADSAIKTLESKIDISVYFKQDTPGAILDQARSYIASLPQTAAVEVVTAEDALKAFKERHKDDLSIMGALGELNQNPLGASMSIVAKNMEDYPFLIKALENPQFSFAIESQTYDDHAVAIERVREISQTVRYFGLILIAIFVLFSALIVYNSIRIAIYTQREEIGIMRLVGAGSSFVRLPLILDGVILALISLLIAGLIFYGLVAFVEPGARKFFDGNDPNLGSYFTKNFWQILLIEGGSLIVIVTISSWAAVGKYLKK
ncbi:MAG: permease-like cell division protein FtsX [Patescibacteria group bacterium]